MHKRKRDRELTVLAALSALIVAALLFLLLHGCTGSGGSTIGGGKLDRVETAATRLGAARP